MAKSKVMLISLGLLVVAGLVVGYTPKSSISNSQPTHPLTAEMIKQIHDTTNEIDTKFGAFKRVDKEIPHDPSQIAHDVKKVNSSTKELVLEYGVFVK